MYYLFSPEKWRFERKYFIENISKFNIESIVKLHPAIFTEIFYTRNVNNIYFDTINFSNYIDNEVGNSKRLKVRIRWYGDLFCNIEKPILEIKIKNGNLGSKISYALDPFTISKELSIEKVREIFMNSLTIPDILKKHLMDLKFSLLNCYKRKYFQSADRKFRITLDSDLSFYRIDNNYNSFLNKYNDIINSIMELKYDEDQDKDAEIISSYFPFRVTKSSKYVSGLNYFFH